MASGKNIIEFPSEKVQQELRPESLDHIADHLMELPAEDRVREITKSPIAKKLVEKLSEQDFYLTIKELNMKDCVPLIALASQKQLTFLFDIEWWENYLPDEEKAFEWLEFIRLNAPHQLINWLSNVDPELFISLLKRWIVIEKVPDDTDFMEARDRLPPFSIDNVFFWQVKKSEQIPLIKTILSTIFELDPKMYFHIMEETLWSIKAEVEEEAFRLRKGRLEDLAIPDFYDALEIYREVIPGESLRKNQINKKDTTLLVEDITPSAFALVRARKKDLLAKAVQDIHDPRVYDFIKLELVSLANKVVVADKTPLGDPASFKRCVDKVASYISLGLDVLGTGTSEEASQILQVLPLETLFRLGFSAVRQISQESKRVLKSGWVNLWPHKFQILPEHLKTILMPLLYKEPLVAVHTSKGEVVTNFFASLQEIEQVKKQLDLVKSLGEIFLGLPLDYGYIKNNLWPLGQPGTCAEVTIDDLILTFCAFIMQGEGLAFKLVPKDSIRSVLESFKERSHVIAEKFIGSFKFSSRKIYEQNYSYAINVINEFKDQISGIDALSERDYKYLKGLMILK